MSAYEVFVDGQSVGIVEEAGLGRAKSGSKLSPKSIPGRFITRFPTPFRLRK